MNFVFINRIVKIWFIKFFLSRKKISTKNQFDLVIIKGGIGDSLIFINNFRKYSIDRSRKVIILTYKSHVEIYEKHLTLQSCEIVSDFSQVKNSIKNVNKIFCLKTNLVDLDFLVTNKIRAEYYFNHIYDHLRLFSRVKGFFSNAYKKEYYSKDHMSKIFMNIIDSNWNVKNIEHRSSPEIRKNKRKIIGIHVSGSDFIRRLKYSTIENLIKSKPEYEFRLYGGEGESEYAELELVYANCISKINKEGLSQLSDEIEDLSCVVGPDSMMIHYCDLLGIPSISLMGNAMFNTYGPTLNESTYISRNPICAPCGLKICSKYNGFSCVQDITAEEVIKKLEKLL
jgi:hypothetical protein